MRRCGPLAVACSLLLAELICVGAALGAKLPDEVRTSAVAATVKAPIEAFLKAEVAKLTSDQMSVQEEARDAIIAETVDRSPAQAKPGAGFLDAYAEVLNEQLLPLAAHESARVRLLVAITAARVAQNANNFRLMPVIVKQLDDPNEAIVLWAIRGAGGVLPSLLSNSAASKNNPLIPALVAISGKHIRSAAVVSNVYVALSVDAKGPLATNAAAWNQVVQQVAEPLQDVLEQRVALYKTGLPPAPSIDTSKATYYLTLQNVWKAAGPKQAEVQQKTVQLLSDLIGSASQRVATAGTTDRTELIEVVRQAAKGLQVVGEWTGNPQLRTDLTQLSNVSPTTAPPEVARLCGAAHTAITKVPQFKNTKSVGTLPALSPTPTTNPTTAPQ